MTPAAESLREHIRSIYTKPAPPAPVPLMAPVRLEITLPLFCMAELQSQAAELRTTCEELAGVYLACEVLREK